jgi:hypothetical protein
MLYRRHEDPAAHPVHLTVLNQYANTIIDDGQLHASVLDQRFARHDLLQSLQVLHGLKGRARCCSSASGQPWSGASVDAELTQGVSSSSGSPSRCSRLHSSSASVM